MSDLVVAAFIEGFVTVSMLTPVVVPIIAIAIALSIGATPSRHPRSRYHRR